MTPWTLAHARASFSHFFNTKLPEIVPPFFGIDVHKEQLRQVPQFLHFFASGGFSSSQFEHSISYSITLASAYPS